MLSLMYSNLGIFVQVASACAYVNRFPHFLGHAQVLHSPTPAVLFNGKEVESTVGHVVLLPRGLEHGRYGQYAKLRIIKSRISHTLDIVGVR
jgi:hypothetical protein